MTETVIVVPCFNEANRLAPESFRDFARDWRHRVFLFVDDGSTATTFLTGRNRGDLRRIRRQRQVAWICLASCTTFSPSAMLSGALRHAYGPANPLEILTVALAGGQGDLHKHPHLGPQGGVTAWPRISRWERGRSGGQRRPPSDVFFGPGAMRRRYSIVGSVQVRPGRNTPGQDPLYAPRTAKGSFPSTASKAIAEGRITLRTLGS